MKEETLEAAKQAQEQIWRLQTRGAGPNSGEGRQAMNLLMTRLCHLSPEEFAEFERWRAETTR